jgi:heme O synthase-like polyprenyltransferase
VPQIVVVSTLTTTSVGSLMAASGTSSHAFWPGPWYTRAFIQPTLAILAAIGCFKIGLGAGIAFGQVGQRDRDGRLAARYDHGLPRGQVGDERALQPAADEMAAGPRTGAATGR